MCTRNCYGQTYGQTGEMKPFCPFYFFVGDLKLLQKCSINGHAVCPTLFVGLQKRLWSFLNGLLADPCFFLQVTVHFFLFLRMTVIFYAYLKICEVWDNEIWNHFWNFHKVVILWASISYRLDNCKKQNK